MMEAVKWIIVDTVVLLASLAVLSVLSYPQWLVFVVKAVGIIVWLVDYLSLKQSFLSLLEHFLIPPSFVVFSQ